MSRLQDQILVYFLSECPPELQESSLTSLKFLEDSKSTFIQRHLLGTLLVPGTLVRCWKYDEKIKDNQSDTISIKLPNEITASEAAGNPIRAHIDIYYSS